MQTLREIMLDAKAPASVRASAASKVVELGLKANDQLDLRARVAALELALRQRAAEKKAQKTEAKKSK